MREPIAASLRAFFATEDSVAAVYVFGSVARATERADSDLDIGVCLKRRHPLLCSGNHTTWRTGSSEVHHLDDLLALVDIVRGGLTP